MPYSVYSTLTLSGSFSNAIKAAAEADLQRNTNRSVTEASKAGPNRVCSFFSKLAEVLNGRSVALTPNAKRVS